MSRSGVVGAWGWGMPEPAGSPRHEGLHATGTNLEWPLWLGVASGCLGKLSGRESEGRGRRYGSEMKLDVHQ